MFSRSYAGLIGAFNKEFTHSGLIDKKYSEILKGTFENRQTGDYGDFVRFNKEEVKSSLNQAEEFVKEINKMTMKYINENRIENKQKEEHLKNAQQFGIKANPEQTIKEPVQNKPDINHFEVIKRKFKR